MSASRAIQPGGRQPPDAAPRQRQQPDEPPSSMPGDAVARAIRREFVTTPNLALTLRQAMRLWGLDEASCEAYLEAMRQEQLVYRDDGGRYRRCDC